MRTIWTAARIVLLATLVAGLGYNLAVTAIAQTFFPHKANGSLVTAGGRIVGSSLIGQEWTSPKFFHGRPSATSPPYNAAASAASNLGPTNPALLKEIRTNLALFLKQNPGVRASQVPPAMVESSASGLDPDIPPQGAYLQAPRVARADHVSVAALDRLIKSHTTGRFLGLYGSPHVNVLKLNLALMHLAKFGGGK